MISKRSPPQPGFLIIGAQKCGTSWLHQQFSVHPRLFLPARKELEFFSYEPHLTDPGLSQYRENFAAAQRRLAGEATASYFWTWSDSPWCNMPDGFQEDIPGVVRAALGADLRLILCLRDPVDRALSAWGHYLAHGELDPALPFREACRYGGIVDMGFYARHLSRWLEAYPAEQILILSLEQDIIADPFRALRRSSEFLAVEPFSSNSEKIGERVFPGPKRVRVKTGNADGIRIHIDALDLQVDVSRDDLDWLQELYQADQQALPGLVSKTFAHPG